MLPLDLESAADLCTENPFTAAGEAFEAAVARCQDRDLAGRIEQHARAGRLERAERILLAAAFVRACASPSSRRILDDASFPKALERTLARPRSSYLRIATAAARGYRALTSLRGRSAGAARMRADTWASCFGRSLWHALVLERVIRDHDVLILGETGTGKDSVADAIQEATPGGADAGPAPRAVLNAAAVPETLIESELFGHVRGAFTGATSDRPGRIRSAAGGCFFLDEIGDLPLTAQTKLLRVMETDLVSPLGSDREFEADVRYVAATHQDLDKMVQAGQFRADLYQRLAGNVIRIPPLRDRPADIADIGMSFVEPYLEEPALKGERARIRRWLESHEALSHRWPGNVRELENTLRNLLLGLPPELEAPAAQPPSSELDTLPRALREARAPLRDLEDWYIARVLEGQRGNYAAAARVLELDRATVRRRARGFSER